MQCYASNSATKCVYLFCVLNNNVFFGSCIIHSIKGSVHISQALTWWGDACNNVLLSGLKNVLLVVIL